MAFINHLKLLYLKKLQNEPVGQDNDGIVKIQYASVSYLPCGAELNPTFKEHKHVWKLYLYM